MFGKPKNAEDILKLIESLSPEEKEKVLSALNSDTSTTETAQEEPDKEGAESENEDTSTIQEEQMPDTEEAEETETEDVQETVNEEPQAEQPEMAEQPQADEQQTETAEQPDTAEFPYNPGNEEVNEALIARIDALEAKVAQMEQANADRVAADNNQDFGFSPSAPNSVDNDGERFSAVMKSYAGRNANKYY